MAYKVEWYPGAVGDLRSLSVGDRNLARACKDDLAANPYNHRTKPLEVEGLPLRRAQFGARGGKRIIYIVNDESKTIVIYAVGDRKTVYQKIETLPPPERAD